MDNNNLFKFQDKTLSNKLSVSSFFFLEVSYKAFYYGFKGIYFSSDKLLLLFSSCSQSILDFTPVLRSEFMSI